MWNQHVRSAAEVPPEETRQQWAAAGRRKAATASSSSSAVPGQQQPPPPTIPPQQPQAASSAAQVPPPQQPQQASPPQRPTAPPDAQPRRRFSGDVVDPDIDTPDSENAFSSARRNTEAPTRKEMSDEEKSHHENYNRHGIKGPPHISVPQWQCLGEPVRTRFGNQYKHSCRQRRATQHLRSAVCKRCVAHEEVWKQKLTPNKHGCSACKNVFDASTWTRDGRKKHQSRDQDLVCPSCTGRGYAPGKYDELQCEACLLSFGENKFDQKLRKRAKVSVKRKKTPLVCLDCKKKLPCSICKRPQDVHQWTIAERRHHKSSRKTALVCGDCRVMGFLPSDTSTYTCHMCKGRFGQRMFQTDQIKNYKHHGTKSLVCMRCVKGDDRIQRQLYRKRQAGIQYCPGRRAGVGAPDAAVCKFSGVAAGSQALKAKGGRCLFCDPDGMKAAMLIPQLRGVISKRLDFFRSQDKSIYNDAVFIFSPEDKVKVESWPLEYCPGRRAGVCTPEAAICKFSAVAAGSKAMKRKGRCLFCDPDGMKAAMLKPQLRGPISNRLRFFRNQDRCIYNDAVLIFSPEDKVKLNHGR